jgi:hypothetical protein
MKRMLLNCLNPSLAAAIGLGLMTGLAMTEVATAGSFTRGCAARDLQVLFIIEEQESAGTIAPDKISDALNEMMHARIVCHEGRVRDALAIYDSVAESVQSIRSGRADNFGIR